MYFNFQILSFDERSEVMLEKIMSKQAVKLIEIILQKPDEIWNNFIDALRKGDHGHVAKYLEEKMTECGPEGKYPYNSTITILQRIQYLTN